MLKTSLVLLLLFSSNSYQVEGEIVSSSRYGRGSATLQSLDGTKLTETFVDRAGKFQFKNVPEGSYKVIVKMDRSRDVRRSIEVRPGFADAERRIPIRINVDEALRDRDKYQISIDQLSIPSSARREFYRALADKGDLEDVRRHLERAIEIAPRFDEALNNLGTVYIRQGNPDKAIELFERALAVNPHSFFAHVNLGGALIWKHDFERALDENLKAMALRPEDGLSRAQAGMALFFLRRYDEAMTYLVEARTLDRFNAIGASLYMARIHEARGEPANALKEYDEFLENHPQHPLTHFAEARVRSLTGH